MMRRFTVAVVLCASFLTVAVAQTVPVSEVHGTVQKADKESLTFQPRDAAGKFGKAITLKITGTSRITILTPQVRDKKQVMTQRDADAKDLAPGEMVSVIYASPKGQDPVLLVAVIQPK